MHAVYKETEERRMGLSYMFGSILGLMMGAGGSSRPWRKASNCKRLIKKLKIRLANQKSRKNVMIRQSRADIAQLLLINRRQQYHAALTRVEQVYKDECRLSAYEQLDGFCDCIHDNLCYISRHSKLSVEVLEALSSLIFGASRCGELPELHSLRNLFRQHFGQKFERINVQLLPGNAVNSRLAHTLNPAFVTHHVKLQLLQEIQNEYTMRSASPSQEQTCNFIPEIKKQKGNLYHQSDHDQHASPVQQASKFKDMMKNIRGCLCFAKYAS